MIIALIYIPGGVTIVSKRKEVDLARGILQLEQEELLWNRKMLMDIWVTRIIVI